MLRDELEAIISSDEGWSTLSTFVLAIGIIGEYVVVKWLEHVSVQQLRVVFKAHKATVLTKWTKRIRIVLEVVFALMVVTGVAGEYGFSSRIARNASTLQQLADQDLAAATDTASAASEEASTTARENMRLGAVIEHERQKTARAQIDLLKLQEKTADRHLTPEQQLALVAYLRGYSKEHPELMFGLEANMFVYGGSESEGIADDIFQVLTLPPPKGARWTIFLTFFDDPPQRPVPGILIELRANADEWHEAAARQLILALHSVAPALFVEGPIRRDPPTPSPDTSDILFEFPKYGEAPIIITIGTRP